MKAMILAAGLGTRLRPLTDDRPKALVEINSRTMLEITLARLRSFNIHDVIINVHHHAEMIADYLKARNNFGMRIEISREGVLLDTGGGLKKAASFFLDDPGSAGEPFILHNVDVISTIDLRRMVEFHTENRGLATLAVQSRESSRQLLFEKNLELCGRRSIGSGATGHDAKVKDELVRSSPNPEPLAFSGIHVISPRLLGKLTEDGVFSIITSYLRLAASGEKILAFRADQYYWRDLGRPSDLQQATQDLQNKIVS